MTHTQLQSKLATSVLYYFYVVGLLLLMPICTFSQVGIGTTFPDLESELDVIGTIRSSDLVPLSASAVNVCVDDNGRLILCASQAVRGKIASNGTAPFIVGATCSRISSGLYRIILDEPSAHGDDYVIQLTLSKSNIGNRDLGIHYLNQNQNSFDVEIRDNDDGNGSGTLRDVEFMFVVYK